MVLAIREKCLWRVKVKPRLKDSNGGRWDWKARTDCVQVLASMISEATPPPTVWFCEPMNIHLLLNQVWVSCLYTKQHGCPSRKTVWGDRDPWTWGCWVSSKIASCYYHGLVSVNGKTSTLGWASGWHSNPMERGEGDDSPRGTRVPLSFNSKT